MVTGSNPVRRTIEYNRMHDFKKRVLDPSIKQIKEHTDITVEVEQYKTGRSITGFSFRLQQKKSANPQLINNINLDTVDLCFKMTDAQRHMLHAFLQILSMSF